MTLSNAVGLDRISRVVGYKIEKGQPPVDGRYLPQRIAILGCANTAQESTAPTAPTVATSAAQGGNLYGYGSPIHQALRILLPTTSDGVGGIPVYVYRQTAPAGAVAQTKTITVTAGSVTANKTHSVVINGRYTVDGKPYSFTVSTDDDQDAVAQKIADAVNSVLGSPVSATVATNVVTLTSKFAGVISAELDVVVDDDDAAAGITYTVADGTAGAGEHVIGSPFTDESWNTIVINPYTFSAALNRLEELNGVADPDAPTGNYTPTAFRPFVALFGDRNKTYTTLTAVTDARKDEMTNVACPAPGSKMTTVEAAADYGYWLALVNQSSPHLDISGKKLPDAPIPADGDIGDFVDYNNRDAAVKLGSSTVKLTASAYEVQDFVTTYHPDGETPAQFNFVRNLTIDQNIRYGYYLLEEINVRDKAIIANDQTVSVTNVIKPKQWKQIVSAYADTLASLGLITDPQYMKDSIQVSTSGTNPDRLETFFRYKRSPIAHIASTDAEANFTFGITA